MPPTSASRVYTGTRCRPSWSGRPRPVGLSCEGSRTTSAGARMAPADLGASIGMPRAKWTGATAIVVKARRCPSFALLVGTVGMKVEWSCTTLASGGPSVTTNGTMQTQKSSAGSWGSVALPKHGIRHILGKDLAQYCWMKYAAPETSCQLSNVQRAPGANITVAIKKMLECLVFL